MGRRKNNTPVVCKHSHFTYEERLELEYYLQGKGRSPKVTSPTQLGVLLQKNPRTISREIKRGMVEHVFDGGYQTRMEYNADRAEIAARERDSAKGPQLKIGYDHTLAREVSRLIRERRFSPYAIICEFNNKGWPTGTRISEKTLYNYIREGIIPGVTEKDLPRHGKSERRKCVPRRHSNATAASRSISSRPEEVDGRSEFGHWEGDTVVSGKGKGDECLFTLTERKTRVEIIVKIPSRTQASVVKAVDGLEKMMGTKGFSSLFRTITFDNGGEFYDVDRLEKSRSGAERTSIYFAHPYCSCERGTNERHNGIARTFIPKGSPIGRCSRKMVREVQDWMNSYPRKVLGGITPLMALERECQNKSILNFFRPKLKEVIL